MNELHKLVSFREASTLPNPFLLQYSDYLYLDLPSPFIPKTLKTSLI